MFKRRSQSERSDERQQTINEGHWARVGMRLTFRAELMPGRDSGMRTFEVARLLASGRVELNGLAGQHTATEFEAMN
jgi:hypothetical protein